MRLPLRPLCLSFSRRFVQFLHLPVSHPRLRSCLSARTPTVNDLIVRVFSLCVFVRDCMCVSVCLMNYYVSSRNFKNAFWIQNGSFALHVAILRRFFLLFIAITLLFLSFAVLFLQTERMNDCFASSSFVPLLLRRKYIACRFRHDVYNINAFICWRCGILPDSSSFFNYIYKYIFL